MSSPSGLPSLIRARSGARFLGVFALTILLPGALLVGFAALALIQDTRAADDEITQRLERAADQAGRAFRQEIATWQTAAAALLESSPRDAHLLPDTLRLAAGDPGALAIVSMTSDDTVVWAPSPLPYVFDDPPSFTPPASPDFLRAERVELLDRDPRTASALYRDLMQSATGAERPILLHRLARTARALGRPDDALAHLRDLQKYQQPVAGPLPADFVAAHEICALAAEGADVTRLASCARDFYRDLIDGRWSIARARYPFYTSAARGWLTRASALDADMAALGEVAARKLALAEAIDATLARMRVVAPGAPAPGAVSVMRLAHHVVATWRSDADAPLDVAMLVSAAWFDQHVGSRVLSSARSDSVEVRIVRADGAELVAAAATDRGSDANAGAAPARTFERTVEIDGLALRLEARPRDVAALAAERSRRQTFYLSLLGVVALVMASGAWFTVRAVRHELAVAQLKADFVAAVSHEFRSPLTGIRQLGELLMRGRVPSDERRQEYYTRITRESDRLTRMVEHLLDFARMESGRREYRLAPVDVGPWLRDVAAAFQAQCPDGVPEIRVSIPDDLPVISADKDALACAVQNLLDNAAKYSPGRPTIWLDAAHGADGLTIRVRDEGEGIGEEDRARIFETFYRGSNTRARHVAGAGIGLGLVQHIVSAHGGRVTCESRPGDGTAFTIHLPAPKSATVPSPAWSARPSARADSAGG